MQPFESATTEGEIVTPGGCTVIVTVEPGAKLHSLTLTTPPVSIAPRLMSAVVGAGAAVVGVPGYGAVVVVCATAAAGESSRAPERTSPAARAYLVHRIRDMLPMRPFLANN